MSTISRGKTIFENLTEYPLPKQSGVRDYIFYFVPGSDGYGKAARYFFDRFFPNHVRREPRSLEDLIASLHTEVTEQGVQHIREIVLVSHGTPQGLILPLLNDPTDSAQKDYKHLTAFSMACLRKDFLDGKFEAFKTKRKKVIAYLRDDSWVTIRACNFGQSKDGMYAFYSFWGGKPNVYAPMEYQFFGTHPIMEGMRFETKLDVHKHLVKQRYLPRDIHTPERKDAIVKAIINPAQFSEPFPLASKRFTDPTGNPEEVLSYNLLIANLNARKPDSLLKSKFLEQSFELSKHAAVFILKKNSSWLIKDVFKHEGEAKPFKIHYRISEEIAFTNTGNRQQATLWAKAKLIEAPSANEYFPLQLFFYERQNDIWRGKLFTLAFYTDELDANPQHKKKFDTVLSLLNDGLFNERSGGGVDIRAEFHAEQNIDLSLQARITLVSTTGTDPLQKIVWSIQDRSSYLIKLEHPYSSNGISSHTITVYENPDRTSRLRHEYELMSYLGQSPDTPGTELVAYLDRFDIEDLVSLIDYLRAPYKPAHSIYIYHAQQALKRKKGFFQWWQERWPDMEKLVLPTDDRYGELSLFEREDKPMIAYDFNFNGIWSEVKASTPSSTPFQMDLFTEEDLSKKLGISEEEIANRNTLVKLESESPYTDIDELRNLERPKFERFFSKEETIFDPPEEDNRISCKEFAAVITKWKEVQGMSVAEIERILELFKTSDGKSYLDKVLYLWDLSWPVRTGLALNNMSLLKDGLVIKIVSRLPGVVAVSAEGAIITSTILAILRVLPAFMIPFRMFKEFLTEQAKTAAVWEMIGKMTAIRQWLRQLELLTFKRENDFPDEVHIDLDFISAEPYFIGRYYQEQLDEYGRYFRFIYASDRMKKGFDEGVKLMDEAGKELLSKADDIIGDILQEQQLDPCEINVLIEANILDIKKIKANAVRQLTQALLDKLPKVGIGRGPSLP